MQKELVAHYSDWILVTVLLSIFFILISRFYNPRKFKAFAYLPLNRSKETDKDFDPLGLRNPFDILMVVQAFFVLSLTVLLINYSSSPVALSSAAWRDFLRLFIILSTFFLVKSLLQLAVAWAFDKVSYIALSQNIELSYLAWLSLVLIPMNVIVVFVSPFKELNFWFMLSIALLGWLQAFIRSSIELWKTTIPTYYKIFYLCSLEIIPFIFLISWIQVL